MSNLVHQQLNESTVEKARYPDFADVHYDQ